MLCVCVPGVCGGGVGWGGGVETNYIVSMLPNIVDSVLPQVRREALLSVI